MFYHIHIFYITYSGGHHRIVTSIRHLRFAFSLFVQVGISHSLFSLCYYPGSIDPVLLPCSLCASLSLFVPQFSILPPSSVSPQWLPAVSLEKEKEILQYRQETDRRETNIRTERLARTARQSIVVETPVLVEARPNLFAGPSAGSSRALPFLLFAHFPRSLSSLLKPLFDVNLHSFVFCPSFIRSFNYLLQSYQRNSILSNRQSNSNILLFLLDRCYNSVSPELPIDTPLPDNTI